MGGMRSILTGFAVGTVIGAIGFTAAAEDAAHRSISLPKAAAHKIHASGQHAEVRVINDEPGGSIVDHALQAMQWRERGTALRFTGRCDSACTLYLALPHEQTCIAEGAYFRFHAPIADTEVSAKLALNYLMHNYPAWVSSWIEQRGGLSDQLITMDYNYARQFMRSCDPDPSKVVHAEAKDKSILN